MEQHTLKSCALKFEGGISKTTPFSPVYRWLAEPINKAQDVVVSPGMIVSCQGVRYMIIKHVRSGVDYYGLARMSGKGYFTDSAVGIAALVETLNDNDFEFMAASLEL